MNAIKSFYKQMASDKSIKLKKNYIFSAALIKA